MIRLASSIPGPSTTSAFVHHRTPSTRLLITSESLGSAGLPIHLTLLALTLLALCARELENPFLIQVARLYAITLHTLDTMAATCPQIESNFEDLWELTPLAKAGPHYDLCEPYSALEEEGLMLSVCGHRSVC